MFDTILGWISPSKKRDSFWNTKSNEHPLRAELFSANQMEQHGRNLASSHKLSDEYAPDQLLTRLAENERIISDTCKLLIEAVQANRQLTPAAEWMLDNFHLIEEQIRTAKRHFSKGYSRGLPRLLRGSLATLPRVYDIALETISHGDGRIDAESLTAFVGAYQQIAPLKLGELWAIPIMLRLALIENLRRIAVRLAKNLANRNLANYWADLMIETAEKDFTGLIVIIADMARSNPPMEGSFVAEIARRLQGQGPALALPLTWVEQRLSQSGTTIAHLVNSEIRQQTADQISVSNSIGSQRFLSTMNWRDFVEELSVVEQILREDPTQDYKAMDFTTRDNYRHTVEKIAKDAHLSEEEVAERALTLARETANGNGSHIRTHHIGFYLIDKGVAQLERATNLHLSLKRRMAHFFGNSPLTAYLGAIILLTGIFTSVLACQAFRDNAPTALVICIAWISLIATSQLAVGIINWLATIVAKPHMLARMDYSKNIPPESRTLVTVPTLLLHHTHVDKLCEDLEIRYLANRGENLHFCLLTDFADADSETLSEDQALVDRAQKNIEALNEKYAADRDDIFFLFHRPRRWSETEQSWLGFERKRGKLSDLNAFLRGGRTEAFSRIVGRTEPLSQVKYVITLDTDTQLPIDAAAQFAAAMAHPLNRPCYDETKKRVTAGYGIIQPRVAVSAGSTNASLYAELFGGETGIDPYTRAVSDVYQDVFKEGSFIGKGIYDVDAFEHTLKDRFPDNKILSHDLLEGNYARSGLLSDIQLYEEYPSRYSADVSRRHRWIRGDWQIAGWLLPSVPHPQGREKNPLSALARWKILDNLRRSIVPPALLLLLIFGWTSSPIPWFWNSAVLAILLIPSFGASLLNLVRKSKDITLRQHLASFLYSTARYLAHALFALTCLAYEAFYHLHAILRVSWRMLVSKKHLLEWVPSVETNNRGGRSILDSYRRMMTAPILAVLLTALLIHHPAALYQASGILILWFLSPAIVWWLSKPVPRREPALTAQQRDYLGKLTRKTWAFFETYVGAEDNWLPPDNIQEHPVSVVAHRTSPTNIGLSLLANLTAYDFGYIPVGKLIERTENTIHTMEKLDRYRGHFYNWYDTTTLAPLYPIYISTVDSGNLAGHLMVLRPGLFDIIDHPVISPRSFHGLADTLHILLDTLGDAVPESLHHFRHDLLTARHQHPVTLIAAKKILERLTQLATDFSIQPYDPESDTFFWAQKLAQQASGLLDDLRYLAPWAFVPEFLAAGERAGDLILIPTLRNLTQYESYALSVIDSWAELSSEQKDSLQKLFAQSVQRATARIHSLEYLARMAGEMAQIDYSFLYDAASNFLTIGFNLADKRNDNSYYDLLASEARLGNFVAIAQGQLPQRAWFALARQMTTANGKPILLSWSGSMFEYLMPLLVMPSFEKTLLDQTHKAAVKRQIEYGAQRGVPWGISESGYYMFDAHLNYQYRAFGVPGLGIKRGLADDLVIAPYACMMGLMVAPEAACSNLQRMAHEGFEGKFGFYEAIDYTASRLPRSKESAIIRSFMVHHQGMGFLSLGYLLLNRPMQRRFEMEPLFQSAMLLLHEKIPKTSAFYSNTTELSVLRRATSIVPEASVRFLTTAKTTLPEVQLLSNGRYHLMVTNSGGSASRWKDLSVTRWREDSTRDNWGSFCYLRDTATGEFWSTTYQPTLKQPKNYEVIFSEGRAEFKRHDHELDVHTEIVVSPEDDIELRRTKIKNRSRTKRTIEVTSYAEVVLAPAPSDNAHPAFSNLFVQTEILKRRRAILCTRRARSATEMPPWMFHLMTVHGVVGQQVSFETDRLQFIGRGRSVASPMAMRQIGPLSGHQGSVLDPIVAIRHLITLDPEQTATIDIVTGAADHREDCLTLIDKYQDSHLADRVFELAWTHGQVILRQLNATESDAQLYGRIANSIVYANTAMRADAATLIKNRRGQSGLWSYAISGDLPIVLVQIKDSANLQLVRQMVQAHAYWRLKGLAVDLVIWNEDNAGYRQLLQEQILGLIAAGVEAQIIDKPGGIFVRPGDQISSEDRTLIESVARIIITDDDGPLAEQINRAGMKELHVPRLLTAPPPRPSLPAPETQLPKRDNLILFNGLGGFSPDGREYVITTRPGHRTPAPWSNVLANPYFGTVISENGQSYTWAENAHSFRLTPWHNDPVNDTSGEAFYIRDDVTGDFWSPMPRPSLSNQAYVTRHGFGYSVFEHIEDGIYSELWVYVAVDASIKFSVLKIRNDSGRPRKLSATGYVELVLGDQRAKTAMHIVTEIDQNTGAIFARNSYNTEFAERTVFFDVDDMTRTLTGDRREFIGRNGSLQKPAAMDRARLSGKFGPGLDPCAAIQVSFDLGDGQEKEIVFKMGVAVGHSNVASSMVRRFRSSSSARAALEAVHWHWKETLGAVKVETPDAGINMLANGWLMYQTIACRLWARSGYYQSGGAFGFRDQLQDTMALVYTRPELLRKQLLLCAAHQFVEGDVQHWWHPPSDRGVRTKCSDDYLWLPLALARYVSSTGDTGVMQEHIHFLEGRQLNSDEDSIYDLFARSPESASLYEHCVRAIKRGLRLGEHGLPLIGSCDWNDGMDKIGEHGKGESVWLGFFLYDILLRFVDIAKMNDDGEFAELCVTEAENLRRNIEANGWDGEWYRRAYYDDGTPLGSSSNDECQIDSLSQSWAVLSGAGDAARTRSAMEAVDKRLVRREHSLVQLLDPPFDKSIKNPGYIRGYVPGVRENGGQYTHAAIWTAMAFAKMGDRKRTWELMQMINPLNHGRTPQEVALYKVEPYVVAADVYGVAPHTGRGGWTWYTGSSGWMYRLILESLLGLTLHVDRLSFAPCLPPGWTHFKLSYRYRNTVYNIDVTEDAGEDKITLILDGKLQESDAVHLVDDEEVHNVDLTLPRQGT